MQITIFSQRLAGSLMMKGFVLIGMRPDEHNTRRNVFIFNDSEQLQQAIAEYKTAH